jgi:hypothetical protein
VQFGRGESTAGLLREHPQQEELVLRRSGIRFDDEISGVATDGAQGVGTGPRRARRGDPAVGAVQLLEASGELWPVEYAAVWSAQGASADQEAGDGAAGVSEATAETASATIRRSSRPSDITIDNVSRLLRCESCSRVRGFR